MKLKVLKYKSLDSTNNKAIKLIKSNHLKPTIIFSNIQKKVEVDMGENGFQ